ncbi:hypothetical protein [Syntrophus aciditrophicus]|uniref:Hypothetical membrane protein n=1 Tax=Syntrophus aciditrophicus (strain SB) TaxID=56780 RepID=Q2LXE6_SYNAS|nr:hypothetical protein [Syntrophus aciditrophicus]ABC78754.1 hypothetical membrane protein [Syntrophus aciditrophicus SB]
MDFHHSFHHADFVSIEQRQNRQELPEMSRMRRGCLQNFIGIFLCANQLICISSKRRPTGLISPVITGSGTLSVGLSFSILLISQAALRYFWALPG